MKKLSCLKPAWSKIFIMLMVCSGAVAILTACGGHDHTHKKRNTLIIGIGSGQVPTLDPGKWADDVSLRIIHDLFEGLVFENQKNEVLPGIAKSWDISTDKKTYIFHLRSNARWSNGKPVTAQDFVYAFKRNVNPETGAYMSDVLRHILNGKAIIEGKKKPSTLGVEALNEKTLKIILEYAYPYFIPLLLNPVTYPLYRPAIKKYGDSWTQVGKMVSNGPYKLKEWVPNGHILVSKNPYYWKKNKVKIKNIRFLPMTVQAEYNAFMANQIDMTWTVPSGLSKKQFKAKFGNQFHNWPILGIYYYLFNFKARDVNRVVVRKALTMTVNRKLIVNQITRTGQKPLYGQLPPQIQGGVFKNLYKDLPAYDWVGLSIDQRNNEAKKMLQEAGYSENNPLNITVTFNTTEGHKKIAEAIAQMWKKSLDPLIKVTLNNQEWKVYLQNLKKGHYQVGRMGGIATMNTADNFTESHRCNNPSNNQHYCNKNFDDYLDKSMRSLTARENIFYMKKALRIAMNDYLILPVYIYTKSCLVKRYVGGYHPMQNHMESMYSKWLYFR